MRAWMGGPVVVLACVIGLSPGATAVSAEVDMAAATRLAFDHLAASVGADSVHVIGYSTGASLAVDMTLDGQLPELPRPAAD